MCTLKRSQNKNQEPEGHQTSQLEWKKLEDSGIVLLKFQWEEIFNSYFNTQPVSMNNAISFKIYFFKETMMGYTSPQQGGKWRKWKTQDPENEDPMHHSREGRKFPGKRGNSQNDHEGKSQWYNKPRAQLMENNGKRWKYPREVSLQEKLNL